MKVTLTFTGAKLKGDVKPLITMPERRVVQDWFTAKNLFVVDSQEDRGIYIIDTALGNEKPTYAKQVSNNSDLQQSIQLNSS